AHPPGTARAVSAEPGAAAGPAPRRRDRSGAVPAVPGGLLHHRTDARRRRRLRLPLSFTDFPSLTDFDLSRNPWILDLPGAPTPSPARAPASASPPPRCCSPTARTWPPAPATRT